MNSSTEAVSLFVVGCPRSGTSLLASMLNAHRAVALLGETHFVPLLARIARPFPGGRLPTRIMINLMMRNGRLALSGVTSADLVGAFAPCSSLTVGEAVGRLQRWHARSESAHVGGDKTPGYVCRIDLLSRIIPTSRFVHIVRDARDVADSIVGKRWGPSTHAGAARLWARHVAAGRAAGRPLGDDRYVELRYESLVEEPEPELRRVCRLVGIDYDPRMLDFSASGKAFAKRNFDPEIHRNLGSALVRRKATLSPERAEDVLAIAGEQLFELGYADVPPPAAASSLAMAAFVSDLRARVPLNRNRVKTLLGRRT